MLIKANYIFTNYWYILFGGVGILFFSFSKFTKTKFVCRQMDALNLKMHIFCPIFLKVAMSVFTRTLSTLNRSGISIIKNLEICAEVVDNVIIAEVIDHLKEN